MNYYKKSRSTDLTISKQVDACPITKEYNARIFFYLISLLCELLLFLYLYDIYDIFALVIILEINILHPYLNIIGQYSTRSITPRIGRLLIFTSVATMQLKPNFTG